MIRYQLICENGHGFDGWFSGSAAFDAQKAKGQLECPACGSARVEKALMTPAVPVKGNAKRAPDADKPKPMLKPDPKETELKAALRKLRQHVTENADYVGDKFAEEARKIHYKEAESRGIYGEATSEEARDLQEEGIEFHPLPVLPEDRN